MRTAAPSAGRGWDSGWMLLALLALTLLLRIGARAALHPGLESDALAYFRLAAAMAAGQAPTDNFGSHAFYSIGYPLLLVPAFALAGASAATAFAVNLALALASALLVRALARSLGLPAWASALALFAHAIWLPGIFNCATLARENLSTPLLLLIALLALRLLTGPRLTTALAAGLAWGAALLAGTSALPLVAAPLLAMAIATGLRPLRLAAPVLALGVGVALVVAPWLVTTQRLVGAPVLTTNSGFNLYLGNNPAATGRFVSIADTPAGPEWHGLLATRGEAGASAELGRRAIDWMRAAPAQEASLAARKLALFWAPNAPSADSAGSKAIYAIRLGEVAQYLLFAVLGLAALASPRLPGRTRLVLAALIAGFWALHGLAYIIPRYRDPVMPLLIVLAAGVLADLARLAPVLHRKAIAHVA